MAMHHRACLRTVPWLTVTLLLAHKVHSANPVRTAAHATVSVQNALSAGSEVAEAATPQTAAPSATNNVPRIVRTPELTDRPTHRTKSARPGLMSVRTTGVNAALTETTAKLKIWRALPPHLEPQTKRRAATNPVRVATPARTTSIQTPARPVKSGHATATAANVPLVGTGVTGKTNPRATHSRRWMVLANNRDALPRPSRPAHPAT